MSSFVGNPCTVRMPHRASNTGKRGAAEVRGSMGGSKGAATSGSRTKVCVNIVHDPNGWDAAFVVYVLDGGMNLTTKDWRSFFCFVFVPRQFTGFSCELFVVSCVLFYTRMGVFDSTTAF